MRKRILICVLLLQLTSIYAQNRVSIYEFGDSIVSCETNFTNLLRNWTVDNVTNANEYEFVKHSYVETIVDSSKYRYYRNYFSGKEPVYGSVRGSTKVDTNGKRTRTLHIKPSYIYQEYYNQKGLPDNAKKYFQ